MKIEYTDLWFRENAHKFDLWFNPNTFIWKGGGSRHLAEFCNKDFNKWWDADKYDYYWPEFLAQHCSKYFNSWWDPNKFDWHYINFLPMYCSNYKDVWFDRYLIESIK